MLSESHSTTLKRNSISCGASQRRAGGVLQSARPTREISPEERLCLLSYTNRHTSVRNGQRIHSKHQMEKDWKVRWDNQTARKRQRGHIYVYMFLYMYIILFCIINQTAIKRQSGYVCLNVITWHYTK